MAGKNAIPQGNVKRTGVTETFSLSFGVGNGAGKGYFMRKLMRKRLFQFNFNSFIETDLRAYLDIFFKNSDYNRLKMNIAKKLCFYWLFIAKTLSLHRLNNKRSFKL